MVGLDRVDVPYVDQTQRQQYERMVGFFKEVKLQLEM
jgi:hypothetical protein